MNRDGAKALLIVGGVGAGLVLLTHHAATPKKVAPTPSTPPVTVPLPTVPTPTPVPVTAPKTPTPVVTPIRSTLIDLVERAIWKEVPIRRVESPVATRTLAVNLVGVCQELRYPLDLALGHALVESDLRLLARNRSSGAIGPLQVTAVAAQQVGVAWPIESPVTQLEAGVRYMLWLRSTYPECAASVRETLRHYGMGRGNWQKYKRGELTCSSPLSVVRAELGCPGTRPYSATAITVARRHPELHTVTWWGSEL